MFTTPAAPIDAALPKGKGFEIGRWKSRVSGQPEVGGLIPSSTMAEEMLTEGDGQVRAMILLMTNPVRSAANSVQLEEAFSKLDFLVAIDFYINETTRHAHIILPTPSPAEQANYEIGLYLLSVRNVAKWSWPAVPVAPGTPETWEVFANIGARLMGLKDVPLATVDDFVLRQFAEGATGEDSAWPDLGVDEIVAKVEGGIGPERLIDMLLRIGPYGDGFGRRPDGLTLAKLKDASHGIDLGPLVPRLHEVINTESGMIELAPATMLNDIVRLRAHMAAQGDDMVLVGRRDLRCSNSFMHNLPALVKGRDRCTLQVSPEDAGRLEAHERRSRTRHEPRREPRCAGRDHRRSHARRGEPSARLGARRRREPTDRREGASRREHQRADGRPRLRRREWNGRALRHPRLRSSRLSARRCTP